MGFAEAVRVIIGSLRKAGKTQLDILNAVKTASDKATIKVNKQEPVKQEVRTDSIDALAYAMKRAGISAQDAIRAMGKMENAREYRQTNNWRKMHGQPMKRKKESRGKGCKKKKSRP